MISLKQAELFIYTFLSKIQPQGCCCLAFAYFCQFQPGNAYDDVIYRKMRV